MTKSTSHLLCNLMSLKIDRNENRDDIDRVLARLKYETRQCFGDDIDKWVAWFLSENYEDHEKHFIRSAYAIYCIDKKGMAAKRNL